MSKLEKSIRLAEDLAKNNNGILPNPGWLRKNGYEALNRNICRHKEKFAHIKQLRIHHPGKTIEKWVKTAEELAKNNNGILPNPGWLQKNGYMSLDSVMNRYRERFAHIKQLRMRSLRTYPDQWVKIAEDLAKNHNNILPNITWLNKNGYVNLVRHITIYPDKFAHIEQDANRFRTISLPIEEHVRIAEELAESNNGLLPNTIWLKKNGYEALYKQIRRNPDKFAHIKKLRIKVLPKSLQECINIAEELVKNNNGILPNFTWLKKHGYSFIYMRIRRFPEKFAHIRRV